MPGAPRICGGIQDEESRENLNPVRPPVHIKVLNNTAGVRYNVVKTSAFGGEDGGFFGNTKFYYNEKDYYLGTDFENAEIFNFENPTEN
jgi:hypothetical protein